VEKQKETISGESSDRSQKKKLGKKCSVRCLYQYFYLISYNYCALFYLAFSSLDIMVIC